MLWVYHHILIVIFVGQVAWARWCICFGNVQMCKIFWDMVLDVLYKVTRIRFPKDSVLFLLNDNSQFPLKEKDYKFWLAASTAANKYVLIFELNWNSFFLFL